ncbi:MAG TPA: TetR/AcrR family transcriptional regulator C-terminal domain-containing protein [Gaiellaceae bacterium]|nr:TetR/AcrR family transcriptional regulator C-terminal domain-containing protein [Gaiellaceae bacterium]
MLEKEPPRRGRPPRLDRAQVVDKALELVDAEGLDALSMRRLGRELGVEGPALYTYVKDKDELLDTIGDRVLDVLELDLPGGGTWQERIRVSVAGWAEMQERHPGGFPLIYRGPKEKVSRTTEELLDALRSAGFDEAGAALAYQTLISFLDGALLEWPRETYFAGKGWERVSRTVDPGRYPRMAEIAPHAAELGWDEVFWSGFELLLGGLEARLGSGQTPD